MGAKKKKTKVLSLSQISKKYQGSGLATEVAVTKENDLWLPCSNIRINHLLGGGIPYGRILEAYGEESSGKSLLAQDFGRCAQALGGYVIWVDAEMAFTEAWAKANGIDLDKIFIYPEQSIERISDWTADMCLALRSQLTNNEPILLVVDSTAALDCDDNINSEAIDAKAEMGNRAKAIYKFFRTRNGMLANLGITSIFINQLRKKVGASNYEDPDTTPGGAALKFFASQRLGLYAGKQIKGKVHGKDDRVGNMVSIRVKKNKVSPPRPTIKTEVYFNPDYRMPLGFHRYLGLPELLVNLDVIQKKGSRFYMKDKMIANGEDAMTRLIQDDPELRKKLLRRSKINTVTRTLKAMAELGYNRYPVNGAEEGDE